jgi:hypothetical protein
MNQLPKAIVGGRVNRGSRSGFLAPITNAQPGSNTGFVVCAAWLAERATDPAIAIFDMRPSDAYSERLITGAVNLHWQ